MEKYNCTDGMADIEIEANSAMEAAQEYVDGGDWGNDTCTVWIDVTCTPLDDEDNEIEDKAEKITVTLDPDEPPCEDDETHDWQSPHEVVGGVEENPGVYGHGGGVIITSVCSHCGRYQREDTWAQNPENGEQGLTSTSYREPDEASLAWVEGLKIEA